MYTISVPVKEALNEESRFLFDAITKKLGKVPNLYATMGYSHIALKAFMAFEETLNQGVFSPKEREVIALVVSELNACDYCLAAHTITAIKKGFTTAEIMSIRKGELKDPKLDVLIHLTTSILEEQGHASEEALQRFFDNGYDEGALMELIGLITVRIFTNYVYAVTKIPIDFQRVSPLPA
ncbi:carboxymuconolactone decarboxylase family protein [Flavitalea antarctica]